MQLNDCTALICDHLFINRQRNHAMYLLPLLSATHYFMPDWQYMFLFILNKSYRVYFMWSFSWIRTLFLISVTANKQPVIDYTARPSSHVYFWISLLLSLQRGSQSSVRLVIMQLLLLRTRKSISIFDIRPINNWYAAFPHPSISVYQLNCEDNMTSL